MSAIQTLKRIKAHLVKIQFASALGVLDQAVWAKTTNSNSSVPAGFCCETVDFGALCGKYISRKMIINKPKK